MRYRIFAALGVLAALTGLASPVHAQSAVAAKSKTENITLSGESLAGIESRTVENDYQQFFVEQPSTLTLTRAANVENNNQQFVVEPPSTLTLDRAANTEGNNQDFVAAEYSIIALSDVVSDEAYSTRNGGIWEVGERVNVVANRPFSPAVTQDLFPEEEAFDGEQQLSVRYQLNQ